MPDDPHAQANADQVRLLREALAAELSSATDDSVPGEVVPAPPSPVPVLTAEAPP